MRYVVVALAAGALVVGGCGNSDSSSPAASGSSPTASTSDSVPQSATGSTWTVEEAGRHYLAITKKGIADINRLKALEDSAPLSDIQSACGAVSDDMFSMVLAAESGKWPPPVQSLMREWTQAIGEQRSFFAQCARADTIADAHDALTPLGQRNSADESALVRAALGLSGPQA